LQINIHSEPKEAMRN